MMMMHDDDVDGSRSEKMNVVRPSWWTDPQTRGGGLGALNTRPPTEDESRFEIRGGRDVCGTERSLYMIDMSFQFQKMCTRRSVPFLEKRPDDDDASRRT